MNKLIISFLFLIAACTVSAQVNRADILQDLEEDQVVNPVVNQDVRVTATLKSASRLFGEKDDLTTVIMILPSGSEVEIIGSDSTYYQVFYEDYEGFIFKRHAIINETPAPVEAIPETVEEEPADSEREPVQTQQPVQEQQVSRFTYLEGKYGSNMAAKLMSGKIWKGMSAEMIRDSWGNPGKINRVISGNVIKEEWIFRNTWLYIENELLMDWGPIRN
ncbi:MAG TPA: hypothetical protein VMW32_12760 [Bacteroidales bacterium]|nr:hypothetical protein [Bacteroidales bacterium]